MQVQVLFPAPALDVSFDTKLTSFFLHICVLKSCIYKPFSYHHLLIFARDQLLSAILQFSLSHAHLGNVRKSSLLTTQNALSPQKCTRYSRRLVVNVASMAVIVASMGSNRREYTSCTKILLAGRKHRTVRIRISFTPRLRSSWVMRQTVPGSAL